ncbi:MAG: hypothetical protein QM589_12215 [Thermomicrobiales bacterium]
MNPSIPTLRTVAIRLALLLILVAGGGAVLALFSDGGSMPAPPPVTQNLSAAEQTYVDTIGVRVLEMNEELQAISGLVSTHSRNVLELNRRGSRVEALAAEMETFRQAQPVPPRFTALDVTVQTATADALNAIGQARDALRRFDFSGIADLIPSFDQAAVSMDEAANELTAVIGPATPAAADEHSHRSIIA